MGERGLELKDLVGLAKLDAVDFETTQLPAYEGTDDLEDCNVCRFRLNGTVYVCIEDPSDGYRSSMRDIKVAPKRTRMMNRFPPIQVLCRHKDRGEYHQSDLLELIDVVTAKVVLEVGTGLMRIDVCGKLQVKSFGEVMEIRDGDGQSHDPDTFYNEEDASNV